MMKPSPKHRQELFSHCRPRSARCNRAAAEVVTWPGGNFGIIGDASDDGIDQANRGPSFKIDQPVRDFRRTPSEQYYTDVGAWQAQACTVGPSPDPD
jgi:hypothetical protein